VSIIDLLYSNKFFTLVKRNAELKNLHKGEDCYIVGNGVSLKYYDLNLLRDKVTIGCNSLFYHNEFESMNCDYYLLPTSFAFHKYRKYYGNWHRNILGNINLERIKEFDKTIYITSLTNYLKLRDKRYFYIHHFNNRSIDLKNIQMDNKFAFMDDSLNSMIGTALWMGFSKIYFIACDYLFSPFTNGHFFESGKGKTLNENSYKKDLLKLIKEHVDFKIVTTHKSLTHDDNYIDYYEIFDKFPSYRENTDIVDKKILDQLNSFSDFYDIY